MAAVFVGVLAFLGAVSHLRYVAFLGFFAIAVCLVAFHKVLADSMEGNPQVKDWVIGIHDMEDVFTSTLSVLIGAFWPLGISVGAWLAAGKQGWLIGIGAAAFWGLLILPVVAAGRVYFHTWHVLNPLWLLVHLFRAGSICFSYLFVVLGVVVTAVSFSRLPLDGIAFYVGSWMLFCWAGVVVARACGLFYYVAVGPWGWRESIYSGEQ